MKLLSARVISNPKKKKVETRFTCQQTRGGEGIWGRWLIPAPRTWSRSCTRGGQRASPYESCSPTRSVGPRILREEKYLNQWWGKLRWDTVTQNQPVKQISIVFFFFKKPHKVLLQRMIFPFLGSIRYTIIQNEVCSSIMLHTHRTYSYMHKYILDTLMECILDTVMECKQVHLLQDKYDISRVFPFLINFLLNHFVW